MQPGNRTGTPFYMAPELVRRRWTDQRLDIFAYGRFGLSDLHVRASLAGSGNDRQGGAGGTTRNLRETFLRYRPRFNHALAKAIMRCVEPNPNDRPQTVTDFLRTIRPVNSDDE